MPQPGAGQRILPWSRSHWSRIARDIRAAYEDYDGFLVVHGTADPVFPIEHGRALALGIAGAVFVEVDRLGHEAPVAMLEQLGPALMHHLRMAGDTSSHED